VILLVIPLFSLLILTLPFGKWCISENATFEEFSVPEKEYADKGIVTSQLYNKILSHEPYKSKIKATIDHIVSGLFNIEALGHRLDYLKEFLTDDIKWDISCRSNLPIQTYPELKEEPDPTFENTMAEFSIQEQLIDDFGVYMKE